MWVGSALRPVFTHEVRTAQMAEPQPEDVPGPYPEPRDVTAQPSVDYPPKCKDS